MSEVALPTGSCSAVNYYKEGSCSPVCYCSVRDFPLNATVVMVRMEPWSGGLQDKDPRLAANSPEATLQRVQPEVTRAGRSEPTRIDPYRHVGRNAPCPCGSGKKFKRCHRKASLHNIELDES